MICYQIRDTLTLCDKEQIRSETVPYAAVLTKEEWEAEQELFDMGIDLEEDEQDIYLTKAEVNIDSVTGTFSIPNRADFSGDNLTFAFALDEKGIVFIDGDDEAKTLLEKIRVTKKWRFPSLERFLYDFLSQIVSGDQQLMRRYEQELDDMEDAIMEDLEKASSERINEIRSDLRDLRSHYEQLQDLAEVLEENDNHFFKEENLRYFRLFSNRIERLRDISTALRDHTIQTRDVYKTHLDIRQNSIMTILTIVTTIFMPLTLIAGWYGMNFRYMPELEYRWSYLVVIVVSVLIVAGSILFFKKRKWL